MFFPKVSLATEGQLDHQVVLRVLDAQRLSVSFSKIHRGRDDLVAHFARHAAAARQAPRVVVFDLDSDICPAEWRANCGVAIHANLCLCIAVRSIEAWLLADAESFAKFFKVKIAQIPSDADSVPSPKRFVVDLARHSTKPAIFRTVVPRAGSGIAVGPEHSAVMTDFALNHWRPDEAAHGGRSKSLKRAFDRLGELRTALLS